jgi:RNase P subunit RPR2
MAQVKERKNHRKLNKKQEQRILYSKAITFLLKKSIEHRTTNPTIAREYYLSARKMGMRGRQHLPKPYRLFFCRSCNSPLQASTMQVRLNSTKKQINYNCLKCGNVHRFGYLKEKQKSMK